jgi:hypothetical protein
MKTSEFRKLIQEEIRKVLRESKHKKHIFKSYLNEANNSPEEKKLISTGRTIIKAQYLPYFGALVLITPTTNITFACNNASDIDITSGDETQIKNTAIKNVKVDKYKVRLEFSNGKTIVLEDSTGSDGIEIYYSVKKVVSDVKRM